jgi:long-chain fatty acid transport protein
MRRSRLVSLAVLTSALVAARHDARAAGLYFSDRGVRPMGRAGAFVAGADDLGAIFYNPAGLADCGTSFLADFSWLRFSSEYTRQLRIVDADNTVRIVTSPKVTGSSPIIPIPTIAASLVLDKERKWTAAGGLLAPYVALANYPTMVEGQPSPSRYALGSFDGSALAVVGGWLAWKPVEQLRIGAGVQVLAGVFQSSVTFSASPQDRLIGAPEQPEFDASSQIKVGPIIAPSANAGVIWAPLKELRVGVSGQLPTIVSAPAQLKVRLPSDVAFDSAHVSGTDAHVRFALPAIFRAGVEVRPTDELRIEVAYVREFWSIHHSIDAIPKNIRIEGVTGLPPSIAVPTIAFPRNFEDSNSVRLGAEYTFKVSDYLLDLRTGISYETSAVPRGYVSLLSLDMDKITLALGGGLHIGKHWRLDAVYAHLFASSVHVAADEAQIPRINPLKGNAPLEAVNGGDYSAAADLIGLGLNYVF